MTRNRALLLLVGVILVVGVTTLIGLRGGEGVKAVVTSIESKSRAVSVLDDVTPTATQAPTDSVRAFLEEAWGLPFGGNNTGVTLSLDDKEAMTYSAIPISYTATESAELVGFYDEAERMPLITLTSPVNGKSISNTASAGILTGPTGISKPVYGMVAYSEESAGVQYGVPTTNVVHIMIVWEVAESIEDAKTQMHENLDAESFQGATRMLGLTAPPSPASP